MNVALTLLAALAIGLLLSQFKVPGGMMIGAAIGACAYNLAFGGVQLPGMLKTVAQVVVGAFIGSGINRSELGQLKQAWKPTAIVVLGLFLMNILSGFVIHWTTSMDLLTALMSTTPGGISDMPIVAADMGADASKVLVLQFVRFSIGIGIFPSLISRMTKDEVQQEGPASQVRKRGAVAWVQVLLTLAVALGFGLLGRVSGIPSGTMAFATMGSMAYKLLNPQSGIPSPLRKAAQCLSGATIGASIGWQQLEDLRMLPLPVLILLLSLLLGTVGIGLLLYRLGLFSKREGMLAATPAGASDMALISADMGIRSINLILVHVMRVIVVITFFPTILKLIADWLS